MTSPDALIERYESGDMGTFGALFAEGFTCYTGELPWRDNKPEISCIPVGLYKVIWAMSPRLKRKTPRLADQFLEGTQLGRSLHSRHGMSVQLGGK